jgi:hypothetical protein
MARLLMKQDRREEAHSMLTEIYNWFTVGFDTADLKDTGALLEELNEVRNAALTTAMAASFARNAPHH